MTIKAKIVLEDISGQELKRLFDAIKELEPGQRYRVFVLDAKKLRSTSQNRYYWGVVLSALADHTGYDDVQLHELMKKKFNLQTGTIGNKIEDWGGSTTNLNTKDFSDYIEKIRVWANVEMECHIPEAGEMDDETIVELINQGI